MKHHARAQHAALILLAIALLAFWAAYLHLG